jgi:hypothetical protein
MVIKISMQMEIDPIFRMHKRLKWCEIGCLHDRKTNQPIQPVAKSTAVRLVTSKRAGSWSLNEEEYRKIESLCEWVNLTDETAKPAKEFFIHFTKIKEIYENFGTLLEGDNGERYFLIREWEISNRPFDLSDFGV